MGMGGQLHAPAALPPGMRPSTHCIEGWVGPRAGLDCSEISRPHRELCLCNIIKMFPQMYFFFYCGGFAVSKTSSRLLRRGLIHTCMHDKRWSSVHTDTRQRYLTAKTRQMWQLQTSEFAWI
jgi:hypothetical protein